MCDLNKPLVTCTLGDFIEALQLIGQQPQATKKESVQGSLPKGVQGIRDIFHCSDYAARQILRSGAIEAAIYRLGARTFVTDPERARSLYQQHQNQQQ